jgi:hypothetical protein
MKKATLANCPKCKQPKRQHVACKNCGTYAGRQVLKFVDPLAKKDARTKAAKKK